MAFPFPGWDNSTEVKCPRGDRHNRPTFPLNPFVSPGRGKGRPGGKTWPQEFV